LHIQSKDVIKSQRWVKGHVEANKAEINGETATESAKGQTKIRVEILSPSTKGIQKGRSIIYYAKVGSRARNYKTRVRRSKKVYQEKSSDR